MEELNISKVERIGRHETNMIRITIANFEHKRFMLSRACVLSDLQGYYQEYISQDLTVEKRKRQCAKRQLEGMKNHRPIQKCKVTD